MAINAKNDSKPRELTPAGNYVARCYQMIELGTAAEEYKGVVKQLTKVRIGWEFPLDLKVFNEEKGEQPIVISKEYTLSLYEKANLRKELESWRGKAFTKEEAECFDITKLLGKVCMINLIHKPSENDPTKIYERISSITPIPKGLNCPEQINPTFVLSFDEWDEEKFKSLPEFIRERIEKSDEYKAMNAVAPIEPHEVRANTENIDDLPF
jgi:hypothetical protein